MPPTIKVPENVKPWKPVIPHIPAPPPSHPDLNRYYEAKKQWKDSTPLYRHINPRPETWIPEAIMDINYKIPTAEEILHERQEYLAIVEEIKDRIPPEYYEHWHEYYSRPVRLDGGADKTGGIDGYHPGMISHPRFMEKDHTKYNTLPRERMFPEEEVLYKMQEVHKVKESLDILEDNGLDYAERTWDKQRRVKEKEAEEEKKIREEVMRGTHWIDWDSVNEEMIDSDRTGDEKGFWSPMLQSQHLSEIVSDHVLVGNPSKIATVKSESKEESEIFVKHSLRANALGFALGASACGMGYGLWKLFTFFRNKRKTENLDEEDDLTDVADVTLNVRRRSVREWNKESSSQAKVNFSPF